MLIAVKLKIAAAVATCVASPAAVSFLCGPALAPAGAAIDPPALVEIAPGNLRYWPPGEFIRGGRIVNAAQQVIAFHRSFAIMQHEVTVAEYARCVADGACAARTGAPDNPNLPAVMASWRDATAYAAWLSRKTGAHYRLPTDAEWTFAAGDRAPDETPLVLDSDDPARNWLARYNREASRDPGIKEPQPVGHFGRNGRGLTDVSGNVWEWTSTCFSRTIVDIHGRLTSTQTENCGVRVVEGPHRTYISDFIRDARAGGCSVGTPPSNLGFRLVRDSGSAWFSTALLQRLAALTNS